MTENKQRCKCTRCKNEHDYSERIKTPKRNCTFFSLVCPRCGCESYYDITEHPCAYCTGYFYVGMCERGRKCQLIVNLKRDNPPALDQLRVRHYTKKSLKNCKYFKLKE
jgi:hypothetical protein